MKKKLGSGLSFNQVAPPETVQQAEKLIIDSRQVMLNEIHIEMTRIDRAINALQPGLFGTEALKSISDSAFAIMPKAGMCDYPFAAKLAKLLREFCETPDVQNAAISPRALSVVKCLSDGLKTIIDHHIIGDGGAIGTTILDELAKLVASDIS